jgi:hypothetical protein
MSDFRYLDRVAAEQIRERVADKQRSALVPGRRHSGRHTLAKGLHSLANRLDG